MFSSTSSTAVSILSPKGLTTQSNVSTLVAIDAGVADYQQLIAGVDENAAILLLKATQNGVAQITSALQQLPGINQLHIISHGAPGTLYLGKGELSLSNLGDYREALANWFTAPNAELLLYGCNVAAGDAGEEFIAKLQEATQVKIAASTTPVGNRLQGANWSLDVTTADFIPQLALSAAIQSNYTATFTWSEAAKLLADATPNNIPGNLDPSSTSQGDQDSFDEFGSSVAIFDGFAIVGVPANADVRNPATADPNDIVPGNDVGSVYVFRVNPNDGSWVQDTELTASDPALNALFGQSVDASKIPGSDDLYVAVGSPGARSPSPTQGLVDEFTGAAYVFKRDAGTGVWSQVQKVVQTDDGPGIGNLSSRAFDQFGTSVSIDGRNLVVGAPNDSRAANELQTGAIYLFEASATGEAWTQVGGKITNPALGANAAFDRFGESIAIADGLIIVGSPNAEVTNAGNPGGLATAGAAYIYRQEADGTWNFNNTQVITGTDTRSVTGEQTGETGDQFGASVDIVNGYAIVGTPGNDIVEGQVGVDRQTFFNAGSAYIFQDQAGTWVQAQQLTGNDGQLRAGDQFGISVGIDDGAAIVGSQSEEVDGFDDPTFVNEVSPDENNPNQIPAPRLPSPGVAYLYELNNDDFWDQVSRVTASDRINGDQFGAAVDIHTTDSGGSSAVVGALAKNIVRGNLNDFAIGTPTEFGVDADLSNAGAAYIFRSQPQLTSATPNVFFVNDPLIGGTNPGAPGVNQLEITLVYDQAMNQSVAPVVTFPNGAENPLSTVALASNSGWVGPNTFIARYNLTDVNTELINIDIAVDGAVGISGAAQLPATPPNAIVTDIFSIDTLNPSVTLFNAFLSDENNNPFVAPLFVNEPFAVFGAFSEPIDPATFTAVSFPVANASISGLALSPDGQSFSYLVTPAVDGSVFTDIPTFGDGDFVSAVTDLRGNPSNPVAFIERIYDITPPEVTFEALDPDNPSQLLVGSVNRPFTVRARFSEPISGFELSDVAVTPGALTSNFTEEVAGRDYLFTVDPVTAFQNTNALISLSVGAGAVIDRATNVNGDSPQFTVAYDGLRPVATTFAVRPESLNSAGEVEGEFSVNVFFNEDVLGFEAGDIEVENGVVTGITAGSPSQYIITVNPTLAGPVVLTLPEARLADLATNVNQAAGPLSVVFNPPAPEVVSITPNLTTLTDSDVGQELVLTILWSTAMDTVTLDLPVISFPTAENPAGSLIEVPGGVWLNDTTFEKRFTIADANLDLEDIDILVAEGIDVDGVLQSPNPGIIEDVFSLSMVNPSLTLNADTTVSPFRVSALFSEDVTGFDLTDVVTTNATTSDLVAVSASEYTFTLTPVNFIDPVSVEVAATAATDLSGNFNAAASLALDNINDAPIILAPTSEPVLGSRTVIFSSTTGNSIVVSDPDAAADNPIEISLTASEGLISLSGLEGLTLTEGDGLGDERITLTGTLSSINAALEGARFKPFNTTGNASLTISADDQGNTGTGGPQLTDRTIDIPVTFNARQDFNGDGFEDVFWTNSTSGLVETLAWSLQETSPDSYTRTDVVVNPTGGNIPSDWEAVGTFDFDGDGNVDILWRNPSTFQNAVWFMNGTERLSSVFFAPSNPVDNNRVARWEMLDVADLDGDNRAEILWRDSLSGQVAIWNTDGLNFQASFFVDLTPIGLDVGGFLPLEWEFGATGDFSGDGRDDVFWRNVVTGQNAIWSLDGNRLISSDFSTLLIPPAPQIPSDWEAIGSGDYNGDGNADILWRNGSQNVIWEFDGLLRSSGLFVDSLDSNYVGIS